jgi:hypothetical protein
MVLAGRRWPAHAVLTVSLLQMTALSLMGENHCKRGES